MSILFKLTLFVTMVSAVWANEAPKEAAKTAKVTERKPQLAVLELKNGGAIDSAEITSITDRLQTEMLKTDKYTVLERRQMNAILQEQGFQQSGVCDNSQCQVEIGKLLGVEQLLSGSVGKVGETYTLNVRIVDVGSGKVLKSEAIDISGSSDDVLTTGCKKLALRLTGLEKPLWPWIVGGVATAAAATIAVFYFTAETKTEPVDINRTATLEVE